MGRTSRGARRAMLIAARGTIQPVYVRDEPWEVRSVYCGGVCSIPVRISRKYFIERLTARTLRPSDLFSEGFAMIGVPMPRDARLPPKSGLSPPLPLATGGDVLSDGRPSGLPSMPFYTPLRYPGGKRRLAPAIMRMLEVNNLKNIHYAEPYAGGAAIALALLFEGYAASVSINDLSRPVFAFWHSVLHDTEDLCQRINQTGVNAAR